MSLLLSGFLPALALAAAPAPGPHQEPQRPESDAAVDWIEPEPPRYELRLSLVEFSMLHGSAVTGVSKYGGDAEFEIKLVKEGEEVVTLVTIENPRLIEVWVYWMNERTAEIVNLSDFDNLPESNRVSMKVAQAVNAKLARSKENPIWDPVQLHGVVTADDGGPHLESDRGRYRLTGAGAAALEPWLGQAVIAQGHVKVAGEFEVTQLRDKPLNTLELFVMSRCPFGTRAANGVIQHLRQLPADPPPPRLSVRYIFYRAVPADGGAGAAYTALHGEEEVVENLVQMVLRDTYPWVFHDYLLERGSSDAPWSEIVRRLGLGDGDLEAIEYLLANERDTLILHEHEYVTGTYGIYDGSPTYVWEGERVPDLRSVPALAGLDLSSSTCTAGG